MFSGVLLLRAVVVITQKANNSEKRSKISKLPKRTYSLEGKENNINRKSSGSRQQSSTTSMIPRPERKKLSRKLTSPARSQKEFKSIQKKEKIKHPQSASNASEARHFEIPIKTKECTSQTMVGPNPVEMKLEDDFAQFKENILKIPEFWSDADQTVKNILKNAIGIVAKQYPTADVEAFEGEIQNILRATELVKREILTKTEEIVGQANQIYGEGCELGNPTEEELKLIAEKMEEFRNDVNAKNRAFGDLLKCGNELNGMGAAMKDGKIEKKNAKNKKKNLDEEKRPETGKAQKRLGSKKATARLESEAGMIQSCGDILRQDAKAVVRLINDSVKRSPRDSNSEDKSCQTMSLWASEMVKREESLKVLNDQILELHQLCKDHITKFKSFNFQIKLRGICNKAQNLVPAKEIHQAGKGKLSIYGKECDYQARQKDGEVHQKNRLMNQQKKLLHVRDELIEMLKNKCNVKVQEI